MDAGKRNHLVLLRKMMTVRDESGAKKNAAVDVARVWASAEPISNRKIRTLDQAQIVETMLFDIRKRPDVDIDWQIIFSKQVFTVRAADRTKADRVLITAEADTRHDRV